MELESYDTWKTGWNVQGTHICRECETHEQRLDECREFLAQLVDQLSNDNDLNIFVVERCLDELCHRLGVKPFANFLTIQRKNCSEELALWHNTDL